MKGEKKREFSFTKHYTPFKERERETAKKKKQGLWLMHKEKNGRRGSNIKKVRALN